MGTLSETSAFVFVALLLCAPGCGAPLQQRIAPYPGYGQQFPQLQRDSSECEAWARSVAGSGADSAAGGAAGGALAGAAGGAALGTIAGAFLGDAGSGAAIGAALGGTSGGLEGAAGGAAAFDQRLLAGTLPRLTPRTITDPRTLEKQLRRVVEEGYAFTLEELELGLNAVAAPVRAADGRVQAAVSVAGPSYRVTPQRLSDLGDLTKEAGEAISRRMGYIPRGGEA